MLKEFKQFALRGSVVDLAVGIIIGSAFTVIVKSLVDDIIMPPIGLLLGNVDFTSLFWTIKSGSTPPPYLSLAAAKEAGAVTINYGLFITNIITFLIVAYVVFLLVRGMNRMARKPEAQVTPTTKPCPYCQETVSLQATRCPHCTSELAP